MLMSLFPPPPPPTQMRKLRKLINNSFVPHITRLVAETGAAAWNEVILPVFDTAAAVISDDGDMAVLSQLSGTSCYVVSAAGDFLSGNVTGTVHPRLTELAGEVTVQVLKTSEALPTSPCAAFDRILRALYATTASSNDSGTGMERESVCVCV